LPGDIRIERENFRCYFPLVTCLLLSVVLSLALWLIRLFLPFGNVPVSLNPKAAEQQRFVANGNANWLLQKGLP
jgi:hypothetical protein